jgi:hypothetical protein
MRMISSFSDVGYLMRLLPQPRSRFFKHTVFQSKIGNQLFHVAHFVAKVFDFPSAGGAFRIASQPAFAGLEELLRPAVIQALGNALAPAQLSDAAFPSQAIQNDPDLLLSRILFACCPHDVLHNLFGRSMGF